MAITFYTGVPGAGKTLRAIFDMVTEYERNLDAIKQGKESPRAFFSNIDGLNLPFCREMPKDWRTLPDGSYCVYDEAHSDHLFPGTGKPGRAEDIIIRDMDQHRHRGFDLFFITQFPTKVHHEIRHMASKHVHVHRAMGIQGAAVFTFGRVISDPYDEKARSGADEELWHYPKKIFGLPLSQLYKSATIHTHKFRMPAKVKGLLISGPIMLAILFFVGHYFIPEGAWASAMGGQDKGSASAAAPRPAPPPQVGSSSFTQIAPEWETARAFPRLAGCAALTNKCRCWNRAGDQLEIGQVQCRSLAAGEMPISFDVSSKEPPPVVSKPDPAKGAASVSTGALINTLVGSRADPSHVGPPPGSMSRVGASVGATPPR